MKALINFQRAAGLRSAQLLAEFSRACQIPVFTTETNDTVDPVDVPMLRSLPRRDRDSIVISGVGVEQNFDDWLGLALQGSQDGWNTAIG